MSFGVYIVSREEDDSSERLSQASRGSVRHSVELEGAESLWSAAITAAAAAPAVCNVA